MTSNSIKTSNKSSRGWLFGGTLVAIWVTALAFGWWLNLRYEFSTAESGGLHYAEFWPTNSRLTQADDRPTLLLFVHPRCPCTRATLTELARLMTSHDELLSSRPAVRLIATVPANADDAWWDTELVAWGQELAGCSVFIDRAGQEAARFGVTTSGTLLLFDVNGDRRYAGGITISRGHEGASAGSKLLLHHLSTPGSSAVVMPVFGCRLCLPDEERPGARQPRAQSTVARAKTI